MPDKPGLNYPEPGSSEALERANRIRARQAQGLAVNPNRNFMLQQNIAEAGAKLRRPPRIPLGSVESSLPSPQNRETIDINPYSPNKRSAAEYAAMAERDGEASPEANGASEIADPLRDLKASTPAETLVRLPREYGNIRQDAKDLAFSRAKNSDFYQESDQSLDDMVERAGGWEQLQRKLLTDRTFGDYEKKVRAGGYGQE